MSAPDRITKWAVGDKFFYEPPEPDLDPPCGVTVHGYLHETPARLHAEELAGALRKLKNEVAGLTAFEAEYREIGGNTNWHCLMQRMHEATAALAKLEKEEGK